MLDSPFNPTEEGEGSMNTVEGRHTGLDTATPVTYELLDWNIRDTKDNYAILSVVNSEVLYTVRICSKLARV